MIANKKCRLGRTSGRHAIHATRLLIAAALLAVSARADEIAEKGRALFKANQRSVVTVQLVLKSKITVPGGGGQSNEARQDATGAVLDPSGLTVLALSATDPSLLLEGMMGGEDESRFKMETELSDIKILLDD